MELTGNGQWKQWEPWEGPHREDLNTTLAELDQFVRQTEELAASKCRMAYGSYVGNGADERYISLPFVPHAVLVEMKNGLRPSDKTDGCRGGLCLTGAPITQINADYHGVWISGSGFYVSGRYFYSLNDVGTTYHYLALE